MTIKPLSGMTAASALTGAELFYAQQSGGDVKVTASQLGATQAFDVRVYGATGNGSTDDTAAIQAAINAASATGGGVVIGYSDDIYLVSNTSSITVGGFGAVNYSLLIKSNVTFDGRWCTIRAKAASNTSIFMNQNAGIANGPYLDTNITFRNIILDGNWANQTVSPPQSFGNMMLFGINFLNCQGITSINAVSYCGIFQACAKSYWNNLYGSNSGSQGWVFGTNFTSGSPVINWGIQDSQVGSAYADTCQGNPASVLPGNPFLICANRTSFGQLVCENNAGGIKMTDTCTDVTIDSAIHIGGAFGTANSGLKMQTATSFNRVSVGKIICINQFGAGLLLQSGGANQMTDVDIGSYMGYNNSTGVNSGDVVIDGTNTHIGHIHSENCSYGAAGCGATALNFRIDNCDILNCGTTLGSFNGIGFNMAGGYGTIGHLRIADNQATPTTGTGIELQGSLSTTVVKIGMLECNSVNGGNSTQPIRNLSNSGGVSYVMSGDYGEGYNTGTAVGSSQTTALQICYDMTNITAAASTSTGVVLPPITATVVGMKKTIWYTAGTAASIKVFGSGSDTIDGVAGATGVVLTKLNRCVYEAVTLATWVSHQWGAKSA